MSAEPSRAGAAREAYYWATVAGAHPRAVRDQEEARKLSNRQPDNLTEWQQWLLHHLTNDITAHQALELAQMWTQVASVQADNPR
ncbi:hypothetical protein [Streptomyces sp. NPDC057496]|uniref:hypothetical protein n=1 Tax=Streptomyces sp. NPDC057496 TaxID=3346149 RepID=UPI00367902D0